MLAVATEASNSGRGQIVRATELGSRQDELLELFPHIQIAGEWEQLLDGKGVDVVLVAGGPAEHRIEQLRRLIQVEMSVLVSHPISLSMLDCYELDMIRAETHSAVLPYLPARWHPAADELQEMNYDGSRSPMGPIEQISFERFLSKRGRDSVLRQFARDADLLQYIAGEATKLHALGSASASGPYANLGVQLTCERETVCRWTVAPAEKEPGARLTLVGSNGKAILWLPENWSPWQLETRGATGTSTRDFDTWNPASAAIAKLQTLLGGEEVDPTWTEAARTVELAETIDTSLKRGRTIDLHHEEFSDIGTFKGTMASVGCGILMAGLALVVLALSCACWRHKPVGASWWRFWIFGPIYC